MRATLTDKRRVIVTGTAGRMGTAVTERLAGRWEVRQARDPWREPVNEGRIFNFGLRYTIRVDNPRAALDQ